MKLFMALVLLGQVATESDNSPIGSDKFSQRPLAVEPTVADGPNLPPLESFAPQRPAARFSTNDAPKPLSQESAPPPASNSRRNPPAASLQDSPTSIPANPQRFVSEPQPPASSEASRYADALLENLLSIDEKNQQTARKVKLVDAISRTVDTQNQATAIGAYWELSLAVARARYSQDKVQILLAVPAPNDPNDQALLESALATAEANDAAAQDEVLAAQFRLIRLAGLTWDGMLPWPADMPLVGPYRTNFESFFAQRLPPLEIRHIHQSLPGKLRLIERCVVAIGAAKSAADSTLESYKQGRAPITLVLQTMDRLEVSQHAFLAAVVDYNDRIAEYSLATVGPAIGPETLVSTLIKSNLNSVLATIPRDLRQAAAEAPVLSGDRTIQR